MGVLQKFPSSASPECKKPLESFSYRSKTTFNVGEGSAGVGILTDEAGAALSSGQPFSYGGTVHVDAGCLAVQVEAVNHYQENPTCSQCDDGVLVQKTITDVIPSGAEFSLSLGKGYYSSVIVTLGTEDDDGVFTAADVATKPQVVRFSSCFSDSCCGTPRLP